MRLLPADEHLLHHALALAGAAAAFASPNPAVGCVLVRDRSILGEGAHRFDLRDHAEIVALKAAAAQGHSVQGATAYVTLEPCSHHGRTGPCADALIAAGVRRCVVATVDPNPAVKGGGLARLRAAGLDVQVADPQSPPAQAARRLNDAFAFSIQHGRPFVTLKGAVSSDGWLAPSPASRSARAPHWITGPAAREQVQELRHRTDALLCGIGTVLADDPALTDRTGQPRRRALLRVVADTRLQSPLSSTLVRTAQSDVVLLTGEDASQERRVALREAGLEVIAVRTVGGRLDLEAALAVLAERQIRSVLLEAGSALNGTMLRTGLVDRVVLYRGPAPLGPAAVPFALGGPSPETLLGQLSSLAQESLPHGSTAAEGEDVRLTGYLHDPWAGV